MEKNPNETEDYKQVLLRVPKSTVDAVQRIHDEAKKAGLNIPLTSVYVRVLALGLTLEADFFDYSKGGR